MPEPIPAAPQADPSSPRDRLVLALDVDDVVAAHRLAHELRPWFGVVKIGLELFSAAGPTVVQEMIDDGYRVFLDLKLADIPTTVNRTARVLGAFGVSYLTMHAFLGRAMLRAGVEGLRDGASRAGLPEPTALAVTILTSDTGAPPHILGQRVSTALDAGCGGVVCAAADVREVKQLAPRLITAVPGLRSAGDAPNDQARVATPESALAAGADLLVIGRTVTAAPNRVAAAQALVADIRAAVR
jgi:orotidine-5'-phosphate decarboxylase